MRRLPIRSLLTRTFAALVLLAGLLPGGSLQATEVGGLYQADVPAEGRSEAHQKRAVAEALRQVAMKVSGRFDLRENELDSLRARADTLVQSYAFVGGGRGEPLSLQVSFDPASVNAAMQQAGLPVWGSNRPEVLLWLVVEDKGSRRFASQELDADLLQQVKTLSRERGLPFALPLYDVQDLQAISAADVWAGFLDNVRLASGRYHPDITVLVKAYKAGLLWQGDWQIVAVGGTRTQDFTGPDLASVIEPGVSWVIQDIASVYAKAATTDQQAVGAPLVFRVSGVKGLQDYAAIQTYLKNLVVIRSIAVQEAGPGSVTLGIGSDTQIDTILQTLKTDGRLVEIVQPIEAVPSAEAVPPTPETPQLPSNPDATATLPVTPAPATAPAPTPGNVHEFEWHG